VTGPAPAVAAIRVAVRRFIRGERATHPVLVACSGGADSLALAAAAAFELPRRGVRCGFVTVDHGLQAGSSERARKLVAWAREHGLHDPRAVAVDVSGRPGGPEAAAREARYEALGAAARELGAGTVLLGHTLDDQAETVLLALARGAGPRGLAGMPARREFHGTTLGRPLLGIRRAETRAACTAEGLTWWEDPHNADPAYARSRVRSALPLLVDLLGAGLPENLARTAALLAADNAVLDALAEEAAAAAHSAGTLAVAPLLTQPTAIRTRVLRRYAASLGATALAERHIAALDALLIDWHGQGAVALPGAVHVIRRADTLRPEPRRPGDP
jgi:tRNA(Ile)-lysidine synthase